MTAAPEHSRGHSLSPTSPKPVRVLAGPSVASLESQVDSHMNLPPSSEANVLTSSQSVALSSPSVPDARPAVAAVDADLNSGNVVAPAALGEMAEDSDAQGIQTILDNLIERAAPSGFAEPTSASADAVEATILKIPPPAIVQSEEPATVQLAAESNDLSDAHDPIIAQASSTEANDDSYEPVIVPDSSAETASDAYEPVVAQGPSAETTSGLQDPIIAQAAPAEPNVMPPNVLVEPARSPTVPDVPAAAAVGSEGSQPATASPSDADSLYQEFLKDEAVYVSEGTWDRFPHGSRLFVGNLFTERVSKRRLFEIFSRHGRMAQIAMKNAYGFIQYVNPEAARQAMLHDEGREMGGRTIHMEVSKPQKNARNASSTTAGDSLRAKHRQQDQNRGPGRSRQGSGAHHEARGHDNYRPSRRSPSPRSRDYDRYQDRRRSRSPPNWRGSRYRSRSPGRDQNGNASSMLRKAGAEVPDVQVLLQEDCESSFVAYISNGFRERGLRCDMSRQPPGQATDAFVKNRIMEGIHALIRLNRSAQMSGKISLQVFDRSKGLENIRYDEYENLDLGVAADIVSRARSGAVSGPGQYAAPPAAFPQPGTGYGVPSDSSAAIAPNIINALSSLDGPALQKLLTTMTQPNALPPPASFTGGAASYAMPPPNPLAPRPPPGYLPADPLRQYPGAMPPRSEQQNVHDIMSQLARFQRQ